MGNSFPDVPSDVPAPHPFYAFIENLFHNGVTGGCAAATTARAIAVTRAQMAVFLLKAKFGAGHTFLRPAPARCLTTSRAPAVSSIRGSRSWPIWGSRAVAAAALYCPGNTVTRGQMAVFLLKALEGSAYDPPDCAGVFGDVTCTPGTGFSDWIEELYARHDHRRLPGERRCCTARTIPTTGARWPSSSSRRSSSCSTDSRSRPL